MVICLAAFTVLGVIPTYVISNFAPSGASIENFPSMSVTVPQVVPTTFTVAPTMGSPVSLDVTTPLNRSSASAVPITRNSPVRIIANLFTIKNLLI